MLQPADVDVPQVRQLGQHRDDIVTFAIMGDAARAQQFVDGQTYRDGATVAHGVLGFLDQFAQQAHAILERAAVFVGAIVAASHQELHRHGHAVAGVAIHDVEPGAPGAQRRLPVPRRTLRMSFLSIRRDWTGSQPVPPTVPIERGPSGTARE